MRNELIEMFVVSLALTIAVELVVVMPAQRCGNPPSERAGECSGPADRKAYRGKGILLVTLVNVLTNPPAVLLCWLAGLYLPGAAQIPVQLAAEIVAVTVEACIYRSFARKSWWGVRRPVLLAAVANLCSWLFGIALNLWRRISPLF